MIINLLSPINLHPPFGDQNLYFTTVVLYLQYVCHQHDDGRIRLIICRRVFMVLTNFASNITGDDDDDDDWFTLPSLTELLKGRKQTCCRWAPWKVLNQDRPHFFQRLYMDTKKHLRHDFKARAVFQKVSLYDSRPVETGAQTFNGFRA